MYGGPFPEDKEESNGGRERESIQGIGNSMCKGPVCTCGGERGEHKAWLMQGLGSGA